MLIFIVVFAVILFILFVWFIRSEKDALTDVDVNNRINDVKSNKELFIADGVYDLAKKNVSWLDPVYYYDIKKMMVNGGASDSKLRDVISQ